MHEHSLNPWGTYFRVLLIDTVCLLVSILIASWVVGLDLFAKYDNYRRYTLLFWVAMALSALALRLYDRFSESGFLVELRNTIVYAFLTTVILTLFLFVIKVSADYSRLLTFVSMGFFVIFTYLGHELYKYWLRHRPVSSLGRSCVLLFRDYDQALDLIHYIRQREGRLYRNLVVFAKEPPQKEIDDQSIQYGGSTKEFMDHCMWNSVDTAVLEQGFLADKAIDLASELMNMGIVVKILLPRSLTGLPNSSIQQIGDQSFIATSYGQISPRQVLMKRGLDLIGALVGMIFFLLAFIIFGPLIKIQSPGGPIIFKQARVGRNGRIFNIYKFRTMYPDAEARKAELMEQNEMSGHMFKLKDDPRIFPLGRFLRKTSIDELPQFINVLRGEMSLVGTRPPTVDEFHAYEKHHKIRLSLKPGITGLWQISGRNEITDFEEVVKLDKSYLDNWRFLKDIKILVKTVFVVLARKGAR